MTPQTQNVLEHPNSSEVVFQKSVHKIEQLLLPWQKQSDATLWEAEWILGLFCSIYNKTEPSINIQHKISVSNPRTHDFFYGEGYGGGRWLEAKLSQPKIDQPMGYKFTIPGWSAPGFEYPVRDCLITLTDVQSAYNLLEQHDLLEALREYASGGVEKLFRWHSKYKRMYPTGRYYRFPQQGRMAILLTAFL